MKLYLQADKILIANKAIDFRRAINGLCALITEDMQSNPTDGVYIFYNKARNRVKIIGYHNNGFVMIYKRLDKGKFFVEQSNDKISINRQQLDWLLIGVDWKLLSKRNTKYNAYF
jgi:transposase